MYWSAGQGHAIFFSVTCCIILCVLERSLDQYIGMFSVFISHVILFIICANKIFC